MEEIKDKLQPYLIMIAVCAVIVTVVFGILGELIGLDFANKIAKFALAILAISILLIVVLWILSFDWTESPFIKATFSGVVMAVLSLIIFEVFNWQFFHTLFIIFAVITAFVVVIGLIKTIFGSL